LLRKKVFRLVDFCKVLDSFSANPGRLPVELDKKANLSIKTRHTVTRKWRSAATVHNEASRIPRLRDQRKASTCEAAMFFLSVLRRGAYLARPDPTDPCLAFTSTRNPRPLICLRQRPRPTRLQPSKVLSTIYSYAYKDRVSSRNVAHIRNEMPYSQWNSTIFYIFFQTVFLDHF